jgi:hypothetical protein
LGVGYPVNPGEGTAGRNHIGMGSGLQDGQVDGDYAIAPKYVGNSIVVGTRLCVGKISAR